MGRILLLEILPNPLLTSLMIPTPEINSTPLEDDTKFEEVSKGKDISLAVDSSSQKKSHGKRCDSENEGIEILAIEVKELVMAIKNLNKNQLVVSELYEKMMKTKGFDEVTLASAFDYLVQHEMLAKAFMTKNDNLRKIWIHNFIQQNKG